MLPSSAGSHRSRDGTVVPPFPRDAWPPPFGQFGLRLWAHLTNGHHPHGASVSRQHAPGRKVGPRAHAVPNLEQIVLQIGLEVVQGLAVHSRGTLVGRNPPVRLPHLLLGNIERLDLRRWHVSSLPPGERPS